MDLFNLQTHGKCRWWLCVLLPLSPPITSTLFSFLPLYFHPLLLFPPFPFLLSSHLCLSFFLSLRPLAACLPLPKLSRTSVGADCQRVCRNFFVLAFCCSQWPICLLLWRKKKKELFQPSSSVVSLGILVWIFTVRFFFLLWSTKEIIALSLTNRTWLLSSHTPEPWCKSWAVPSACINLIRETPFQRRSLEDAHWGRFCREVARWKHFLRRWVPKEIGWRLHPCYNKKECIFLGGTFSDCSNCHWQRAILGTWVLQWPHWSFKASLGMRDFLVLWVSCGCKSKRIVKSTRPGCPHRPVKGCDITWNSVALSEWIPSLFLEPWRPPMRAHLHLVTVSPLRPVHALLYKKQWFSLAALADCGIFSSRKLTVSFAEQLSMKLASFYSHLGLEQYNFGCFLDL